MTVMIQVRATRGPQAGTGRAEVDRNRTGAPGKYLLPAPPPYQKHTHLPSVVIEGDVKRKKKRKKGSAGDSHTAIAQA